MMKKLVLSLLVTIALFFATREVDAAPSLTPLGIEAAGPVAAVQGNRPNTLVLAWIEETGTFVGEWSIPERRMLQKKKVRTADEPGSVKLARSGERVVLARAGKWDAQAIVEVFVFDRDLVEQRSTRFYAEGASPNLDADADRIVLGTFEETTPVIAPIVTNAVSFAPHHGFHVRVLDPSTLEVKGARVFRGQELLRPSLVHDGAEHALALLEGTLFVALPDAKPTIVALTLPSLSTLRELTVPQAETFGASVASSMSIARAGRELVVRTNSALWIVSRAPSLHERASLTGTAFSFTADGATGTLLANGSTTTRTIGSHAVRTLDVEENTSMCVATRIWAFGRPVVISTMVTESGTKKGIFVGR